MANTMGATQAKRKREQAKRERKEEKRAKRTQRNLDKKTAIENGTFQKDDFDLIDPATTSSIDPT